MAISYSDEFLPLLYNALEEEIGLYVRSDNAKLLRATLYDARTNAADESLSELMLFFPLPDTIFIAKRSTELPE